MMKITPHFLLTSLFSLLVFSIPLYFRFVNEELFEFNKIILLYTLTICIGFVWIVRMIFEKKVLFQRTLLDYPIGFFVLSQLLSTIFSIHPYTSWLGYYSRFNGGLLSTLCYVGLFYAFVSNMKKKDLGNFFLSAFLSGFIVAIYGILEHFGHSFSCLLVPGNSTFGVDCWVQDVQSRVFASFGQPNWLAAYVVTILPIGFVIATQKKISLIKRLFFMATTVLLFMVLLYTRSRSGIAGIAGGGVVFLMGSFALFGKDKAKLPQQLHLPTVLSTLFIVVFFTLITDIGFNPSISKFLKDKRSTTTTQQLQNQETVQTQTTDQTTSVPPTDTTTQSNISTQAETVIQPDTTTQTPTPVVDRLEGGGTDSGEIRKIVWTGALKVWQRYPIIGSGVETFAYSYYKDRIREHNDVSEWDFLYNKAHNELLNLLATTGIFGLLTYLSIFVFVTYLTARTLISKSHTITEKFISLALFSGQIALFISNFFGFSTVTVNIFMYLFFAITWILYADSKEKTVQSRHSPFSTELTSTQYLAVTITAIVCLFFLFKVYNYWAADKAFAEGKNYFNSGQYQYGIQKQLEAISRSPKEAVYYDTLSDNYSQLAAHFATVGDATIAAQITNEAISASNQTLKLNNKHLNFYKTKARVMVTLSQVDETFLTDAKQTLLEAMQLAPTDPKLVYTLAVIEQTQENTQEAKRLYQETLALKPDYERALWKISELYEAEKNYAQALPPLEYILKNITPGNQVLIEKIESLKQLQAQNK